MCTNTQSSVSAVHVYDGVHLPERYQSTLFVGDYSKVKYNKKHSRAVHRLDVKLAMAMVWHPERQSNFCKYCLCVLWSTLRAGIARAVHLHAHAHSELCRYPSCRE